jgi:hypothetical protein
LSGSRDGASFIDFNLFGADIGGIIFLWAAQAGKRPPGGGQAGDHARATLKRPLKPETGADRA